ncbi:hypothetical protein J1605_019637 [Eschrichtius robustus]|uniref:Uncharacterized protein n=1 Tax=Eschrichtius robustus TaxID=9764 RepID=A0AB34HMP9_ESCRO|nr:hypothetical protein J1605_019637 [Eschrichtius robustus]
MRNADSQPNPDLPSRKPWGEASDVNCETFWGDRHVSRPLEGRLVSAVTEFAIEDYGSRQPSLGKVREGCLQAVALGAEAQREPGVTQVAVGQSIGAGAQEKPEHGDVAQHAARPTGSGTPEGRGLRQAGEKPCVEPAGAPGRGGLLYQMKEAEGGVFMTQSRDDLQRRATLEPVQ